MKMPHYKDLVKAKIFLDSIDYNLFNYEPLCTLYELIENENDVRDAIKKMKVESEPRGYVGA